MRPRVLNVLQESALSPAELTLATTLQGQLARTGSEGLYLDIPSLGYRLWLDDLADRYGVRVRPGDLWKTLEQSRVAGYVLFRQGTSSVNVATTLAGLTGAVAIEESLEATAIRSGLRKVLDVRDKDEQWVWSNYSHRLRHDVVIEQKEDWPERLRDYATMAGAFAFFDGNSAFRAEVVGALDDDATVIGWGDAANGEDTFIGPNSDSRREGDPGRPRAQPVRAVGDPRGPDLATRSGGHATAGSGRALRDLPDHGWGQHPVDAWRLPDRPPVVRQRPARQGRPGLGHLTVLGGPRPFGDALVLRPVRPRW